MKRIINSVIIIFTIAVGAVFFVILGKDKGNFYGDGMGYYTYLPSTFIVHNLKEPQAPPDYNTISPARKKIRDYLSQIIVTPKGYLMNQYTYGVAVFELPFFAIAHGYEKLTGLPASGFSPVYDFMIKVSTLFYAILGLYILFLCLKRFFDKTIVLIGLCALVLGTNFLWFATIQTGMAHIIIFFLVPSLIYFTIKVHEAPRFRYFLLAGLSIGMIALIRPTDVIFISIPFLYKVYSWKTLVEKLRFIFLHKWKILGAALLASLLAIPQLMYWKELTGHYIFYSYGENQKFHWRHPHIYDGLFSYMNGWLVYSPLMILSVVGMLAARKLKDFYLIILCTLPVFIYLIYAWYCWNYINGFGSRPMIHIYPLLAFPFVALLSFIAQQKKIIQIIFSSLVVFLSAISVSYTIQQALGNLWSENSKKEFNLHTLFRYKLDYNDIVLNDNSIVQPKPGTLKLLSVLDSEDFEHYADTNVISDSFKKSKYYYLHDNDEYPERTLLKIYNKEEFKNGNWIKLSGEFNVPEYAGFYENHLIVLEIANNTGIIYWKSCVINNKIGLTYEPTPKVGFNLFDIRTHIWGEVYFFVPVPNYIQDGDKIKMMIWSVDRKDILMDNLKMELFQ